MGKRMNWARAKAPRETEVKYDDGTVLGNGEVVSKPLDGLAKRARAAEERWLRSKGMNSLNDKPRGVRKKQKYKPKTKFKPRIFDDVVMTTLDRMDRK